MRQIYLLILAAVCLLTSADLSAQDDRNMILHLKDHSNVTFPVSSIDSISFEKTVPEEKAPFKVELNHISELYTEYTVIPDDPTMTYNIMCEPKSVIEEYPNDEAIFADDKIFFQELADGYGMTLQELLGYFLIADEFNDFHTDTLCIRFREGVLYGREIGDVLGKTENWARVTFYRSKERLKGGLDHED